MWCVALPLRRLVVRHVCTALLLALWIGAIELPCVALAWPGFLRLTRGTASTEQPDRTAAQHPPRLFPGAAERAEQARALWQEAEAKGRLSPCWKRSLLLLQAKCGEVQKEDAMRSRLALFMATCDADNDGRVHPTFHCGSAGAPSELSSNGVRLCVQGLSDTAYATFVQYRLHADVLCAYLQEELYQERTEAAVAAMLRQMEGSADALAALRDSEAEMFTLSRDTQALQRETRDTTAALQQQLASLHDGHATALHSLRAAADDILHTSSRTDAALTQLHAHVQEAAAEALASVQALSLQSLRQFAAVEEQTRGMVQLMEQVDHVQRLLTHQSFSWHRVVCAVGCVAAVLVTTCPPQTAAARPPALALTLVGTMGVPLLRWWCGSEWRLLARTGVWQSLCAACALTLVCRSAYRYTPPEVWQRRLLREETQRLWRELRPTTTAEATTTTALQPYVTRVPAALSLEPFSRALPSWPPRTLSAVSCDGGDHQLSCHRPLAPPVPCPLSIDTTSEESDGETPSEAAMVAAAPCVKGAEVVAQDVVTPPQRKRGRPRTPSRVDDGNDSAIETKAQRVEEAPSQPQKATPTKQRGGRRASTATPKKKG